MTGRGRSRRRTPSRSDAAGLLPGPGQIVPPADLSPEALEPWHELAPHLARLGVLHGNGAGLLAEHCRLAVQWQDLCDRVRAEGVAMVSQRGMGGSPRLKELLRISHRLLDLEDRLGMSPMARVRMGLQ